MSNLPETRLWLVRLHFQDGRLNSELFERGLLCVDQESQAKIRKFYHLQDRWRCLIGRILPRVMLKERGVSASSIEFGATESGKPFIISPADHQHIAFNVTHDNDYIGMAFYDTPKTSSRLPQEQLGVDLMKVEIPRGETPRSFAKVLSDQLSANERQYLQAQLSNSTKATETIFRFWTMKEAYTKALGIGLGFDFSRVECDLASATADGDFGVSIDGTRLSNWEFREIVWDEEGSRYMGMVANAIDCGSTLLKRFSVASEAGKSWIKVIDAADLIDQADPLA